MSFVSYVMHMINTRLTGKSRLVMHVSIVYLVIANFPVYFFSSFLSFSIHFIESMSSSRKFAYIRFELDVLH